MSLRRRVTLGTVALLGGIVVFSGVTTPPAATHLALLPNAAPSVRGVFHVHTVRSDGTGTVDRVARAAAAAGLQFVVFTDHGDGIRTPDRPVYRHGILCIDAVELSTSQGHYAAIGMASSAYPLRGEPRTVVEDVHRLGGFGIVTHPDSPRARLAWEDWGERVDGVEWLNGDTEWREKSSARLILSLLHYPWRAPETVAALLDAPDGSTGRWDELSRQRPVVGLAGADAHGGLAIESDESGYGATPLVRVPTYESIFRACSLRVETGRRLSGNAPEDADLLLGAIRTGRVTTVIDGMATPGNLEFTAETDGRVYRMGESVVADGPLVLAARSNAPAGSRLVLRRDGVAIETSESTAARFRVGHERAAYRVEVWLPDTQGRGRLPWIVGNPVYVDYQVDALVLDGPRQPIRTSWELAQPLMDAVASGQWSSEHERSTNASIEIPGIDGRPIGLAVTLGRGRPSGQYGALVRRIGAGTLPGQGRIRLRVRADRPCRVSVQLRRPGGPDGLRWWRSLYVARQGAEMTVPFEDLRGQDGRPPRPDDLSAVDSVLIVVDTANLDPGESRALVLEDIAIERAVPVVRSGR